MLKDEYMLNHRFIKLGMRLNRVLISKSLEIYVSTNVRYRMNALPSFISSEIDALEYNGILENRIMWEYDKFHPPWAIKTERASFEIISMILLKFGRHALFLKLETERTCKG